MSQPGQRRVDVALLAVAVVWGSSYLATKEAVPADGVFAFLVLRFAVASVGLATVVAPRLRGITRAELVLGSLFGMILSVILALETLGVTRTSAANAGLIISLTIILTPLLESARLQKMTRIGSNSSSSAVSAKGRAFYGAAALAVAGVVVLTQNGGFAAPSLGDLLILLAAVARSVHVIVIARLSTGRSLDSSRLTLVQLATALGVVAILSSVTGRGVGEVAAHLDTRSWLLTVYLALACTVFAFVVQMWAASRTSAARVSLLLGTEPMWAAAFGVALAGNPLTIVGVAGALMILAGIGLAQAIDSRAAAKAIPAMPTRHSPPPRKSLASAQFRPASSSDATSP